MNENPVSETVVYLIDSDLETRQAFKKLTSAVGLRNEVYDKSQIFLDHYQDQGPACIVTEMRLPEISGMGLQRIVKERGITHPIIFYTQFADVPSTVAAFREGAFEFLLKPTSESILIDIVQRAIEYDIRQRETQRKREVVDDVLQRLSPREQLVLSMLALGLSNKDIAQKMDVTKQTVSTHRAKLMDKFGMNNLTELIVLLADCELLQEIQHDRLDESEKYR